MPTTQTKGQKYMTSAPGFAQSVVLACFFLLLRCCIIVYTTKKKAKGTFKREQHKQRMKRLV